ncbi:MAG: hypothetical protein E7232_06580 [Lachnospiraceae bacterium]|jgi:hypothetical protein|nr:hypothetical protein [Lachnospiraceae bacterium]
MEMNTRGRVPAFLQRSLAEEIRRITAGMTFKQPRKAERIPLQVFEQALPVPSASNETVEEESIAYVEEEAEEAVFKCPWCVVRIDSGSIQGPNANVEVLVGIEFGIFDDDPKNQGHYDVENLMWKVYERFAKDPILAKQYTCQCDFKFGHQDSDTNPYYFGAISMTFEYPGIQRESGGIYL